MGGAADAGRHRVRASQIVRNDGGFRSKQSTRVVVFATTLLVNVILILFCGLRESSTASKDPCLARTSPSPRRRTRPRRSSFATSAAPPPFGRTRAHAFEES